MGETVAVVFMAITVYWYAHLALHFWCAILYKFPPPVPPLPPDNQPVNNNAWFPFFIYEEFWDE